MKTKEKIRESALKLFSENGYTATSIGDIAKEVGVKKATIYSHITTKEELYLSLLDEVLEWDREHFRDLLDRNQTLSTKAKIELLLEAYCTIYLEEPLKTKMKFLNRAMLFPPEGFSSRHKEVFKEKEILFMPLIVRVIRDGIKNGCIGNLSEREVLVFFYCTVDGLFVESCYYTKEDFKKRFECISKVFWNAIKV